MIVVDTNIISYFYLQTTFSSKAELLFQKDPDWAAPILWKSEFRNVLALYLRKKLISFEQAVNIQDEAESLFGETEYEISSSHVLSLVNQSSCSAYDCEFIALAQQLNVGLITQDKKLLLNFPSVAISIDTYLNSRP
ncbi:MAG: PIN domain-containing protein [Chitinivibrionales bacterium]|nr:PIN domain-containing protein [Chitinivibrionales bacterium]